MWFKCQKDWLGHLEPQREAEGSPGGSVVKNLPASAGDTGSIPGPGRSHVPGGNKAHLP